LSYNYRYRNMVLGINSVFSSFSEDKNFQLGASFLWYPFGNLNLYSYTEITAMNTIQNEPRLIVYQKIGFRAMNKVWLEFSGFYGDVRNSSMISSNYSFEIANHTNGIANAKVIYTLSPKIELFASAQYWWRFTDRKEVDFSDEEVVNIINYQQLNFIGGLKWNF